MKELLSWWDRQSDDNKFGLGILFIFVGVVVFFSFNAYIIHLGKCHERNIEYRKWEVEQEYKNKKVE